MKANKIFSALFSAALVAGFSACTDEVDYEAAVKTPGFYFPVDNISAVELSEDGTSFDITVGRIGTEEAVTVDLRNNFNPNDFTMPISVVFDEGELLKTVSIYYDGKTLAPGKYDLEIGFYENSPVSQYGKPQLKISATMPEPVPVVDWKDLGECTYTDPFLTSGFYTFFKSPAVYKVHIEESGDTPGLYRLVAPYGTAFAAAVSKFVEEDLTQDPDFGYDKDNSQYLYIHAEDPDKVYILPQQIAGAISLTHGTNTVMNDAGYEIGIAGKQVEEVPAGSFGKLKDGVLTLPLQTALINVPGANPEKPGAIYYANSGGAVKMIVMPGVVAGDFSAKVDYLGQFNNVATGLTSAVVSAEFGEDVAYAKAGIVNAQRASKLIEEIKSGAYSAVDVDVENPSVSLPVYTAGTYTAAIVTYDSNGEAQDAGTITFDVEVFSNDAAAWKDLGYSQVADGWIMGALGLDEGEDLLDYVYEVSTQESVNVPGLFRFKNVWGTANPLGSLTQTPTDTWLYINASDPEFITITPQFTGWTYGNFGSVYAFNWEGYVYDMGYDKEYAQKNDFISTAYEDGIIYVNEPGFCGTGKAFGSGYGFYGAGEFSAIFLPEQEENPDPASIRAALKSGKIDPVRVNKNRKFESAFKLARKTNADKKAINPTAAKF